MLMFFAGWSIGLIAGMLGWVAIAAYLESKRMQAVASKYLYAQRNQTSRAVAPTPSLVEKTNWPGPIYRSIRSLR
jgi:hypothetical protein